MSSAKIEASKILNRAADRRGVKVGAVEDRGRITGVVLPRLREKSFQIKISWAIVEVINQ